MDHWSGSAVDRLHALGVTPPGTVRGQRSRTIAEVRSAFEAADAAGSALAAGYLDRFAGEFGEGTTALPLAHASVAAGIDVRRGDVAHGVYSTWGEENWTGVRPLENRTTATGDVALLASLGRRFAAGLATSRTLQGTAVDELYAGVGLGPVGLWVGRRLHGFGPGVSGVVLNGTAPVDGVGLHLAEPVGLPGPLRHLGPVRVDIAVARLDRNGPVETPWYVMTRGSIEPHPRLGFGVMRSGMIGQVEDEIGVDDVLFFLVGGQTNGSEYDNQVVSVDAWYRPPLGTLPLMLYVEWGAEDGSGAWWRVPGIVAGIELAAVPGLPQLSLLLERSSFERSDSGNPPWYRHPIGYHDGWSIDDRLLGHPLGGHGQQWLAQARADVLDTNVQLLARAFTRTRRAENLFAPERAGRSTGVEVGADARLTRGVALQLAGSTEKGSGWRRSLLSAAVRVHLPHRRVLPVSSVFESGGGPRLFFRIRSRRPGRPASGRDHRELPRRSPAPDPRSVEAVRPNCL